MRTRRTFDAERGRAAPTREGRTTFMTSLHNAPVPEVLTFVFLAVTSVQIWGPVGVLLQIVSWSLLLLYLAIFRPHTVVRILKFWPLLVLPLYALASTVWSVAPEVSSRYGTQFMITALMGVTLACACPPRSYVALLYGAMIFTLGLSLTFYAGRYGPSEAGPVLIGTQGSKNEMGYTAQMAVGLATAVLLDRRQPMALRLSTLLVGPVSLIILSKGEATGALIACAITFMIIGAVAFLHLLKLPGRLVVLTVLAITVTPIVVVRDQIEERIQEYAQQELGKDMTTLTGRTWLWARADELIKERPLLGRGYRAVLIGNTVEGEGILAWAGQRDGRAFHFHNTYRDMAVDLGYPGAALFGAILFLALPMLVKKVVSHPTPAYAVILSFLVVVIAKSTGELVVGQFAFAAVMLFSIWVYAFSKPQEDEQWVSATSVPGRARWRMPGQSPLRIAAPVRQR